MKKEVWIAFFTIMTMLAILSVPTAAVSAPPTDCSDPDTVTDWAFIVELTDVVSGTTPQVTFDVYFYSDGTPITMTNFDLFMTYDDTELAFVSESYYEFGSFPPYSPGVMSCAASGTPGVYSPVSGIYGYQRYTGAEPAGAGLSMCDGTYTYLSTTWTTGWLGSVTFDVIDGVCDGEDDYAFDLTAVDRVACLEGGNCLEGSSLDDHLIVWCGDVGPDGDACSTGPWNPADVNGDCAINIADIALVGHPTNWGQNPPANPATDVNGDGNVNIADIALIGNVTNWGASCP